jgi:hypothetical protein
MLDPSSIQERAWEDFTAWELYRHNNYLPVPADISESADMYARHCEKGHWPIESEEDI